MKYTLFIPAILLSFALFAGVNKADGNKTDPEIIKKISNVRIPWIQNNGQQPDEVAFYAKTFAGSVFVNHSGEIIYNLPVDSTRSYSFTETFISNKKLAVTPGTPSETKVNYFIGNNAENWKTDISTFQSVNLGQPWKGIKVECNAYGNNIEKLFIVDPGADPSNIKVNIKGAKKLKISDSGELIISTPFGETKFTKPIAYQIINQEKLFCKADYRISNKSYGFEVSQYNPDLPLIIDPLLASTFIGGGEYDVGWSIALDELNNVYITGWTSSTDFPVTSNGYDTLISGSWPTDVYISKFDPMLTNLLSSTFIGGNDSDVAFSLTYKNDNIYITGRTMSSNFPTTLNSFDPDYNGDDDVFISKLNANLDDLLSSTYIGSSESENGRAIMISDSDEIFVTGSSRSLYFPTTSGAFDVSFNDISQSSDIFISKFNSDLSILLNSTFLGGYYTDTPFDIVHDNFGNIFIAGETKSDNFPVSVNCYDNTFNSINDYDIFISKLNSDLSQLIASTFLGGQSYDRAWSIVTSPSSTIYITGTTFSIDFPTTSESFDESFNGLTNTQDAFISKLDNNLTTLLLSTFIGGASADIANSIIQSSNGQLYIGGFTSSPDFPITFCAFDTIIDDNYAGDVFISRIDTSLSTLISSTYVGGSDIDNCQDLILDNNQNVYFTGYSASFDYPTSQQAFSQLHAGDLYNNDVIISLIDKSLKDLPVININPVNSEICEGTSTNFTIYSVNADSFQWQLNEGAEFFDLLNNEFYQGVNNDSLQIILAQVNMNGFLYRCRVTNEAGDNYSDTVLLFVNETTEITLQPSELVICVGQQAVFSITAIGENLMYQWRKNGDDIQGANNPEYIIYSAVLSDNGFFDCVITGECGNALSDQVTLVVNPLVEITLQPQSLIACEGDSISFLCSANGVNLSFQWRHNANNITGAIDSILIIDPVSAADIGSYDCIVNSDCGTLTCNPATLSIPYTQITVQPQSITSCENENVTFSVTATGLNLTYQWRKDLENISGASSSVLNLYAIGLNDEGNYDCAVTGLCDFQISNVASLTVHVLTEITNNPLSDTMCEGESTTFTIEALGYNLAYQWFKDSNPITGATSPDYQITNAAISDIGLYSCEVSGECGVLISNSANLVVYETTEITQEPPSDITACVGENMTLVVQAIGNDLSYQWSKSGEIIPGAINPSFSITNLSLLDQGSYQCEITGTCGTSSTAPAILVVYLTSEVVTQPVSVNICEGNETSFWIQAVGQDLSYQWRKDGTDLPGQTDTLLNLTNASLMDAGTYDCMVSGYCNTTLSEPAILEVWQTTEIISQPDNITACEADDIQFSVSAVGHNLSYQWYQNGTALTGETDSILLFNDVNLNDIGSYDCVVTGDCGVETCNPASLEVIQLVGFAENPAPVAVHSGDIVTFSVSGSGPIESYHWRKDGQYLSDDGNISGSLSVELVISNVNAVDAGEYDCEITGECNTEISESATLTILGISTHLAGKIKIYPNPTTGLVTILNEGSIRIDKIVITNQIGYQVFTASDMESSRVIDLSGFGKGIYLIEVQTDVSICNVKIFLK